MLVIGIDPGTATTGYGIVDEDASGKIRIIDYGVIRTEPDLPVEKRLQKISDEIRQIISLHHPQEGAVEKLFFQRNVTNAIAVGQARGVILLALADSDIKISEYTPTEIKLSITGYGAADKKQIQKMVQTLLDLPSIPQPDDAADALAVAISHIHATGYLKLKSI